MRTKAAGVMAKRAKRAEARSQESAWHLTALPPQGLELAADRVGDVALPLPKALPGPPV